METLSLLGAALGFGVLSGLNLYATIFSTGLALRLGWLTLSPAFGDLSLLEHPVVLAVSGLLFLVEALADKIPFVEHLWDLLHTVIRPLGAVLLAWVAIGGRLSEPSEVLIILVAGGAAFTAHAGKAGLRLASTAVGGHAVGAWLVASVAEDVIALLVAPLVLTHPLLASVIALFLLVALAWGARFGLRFLRSRYRAGKYFLRHRLFHRQRTTFAWPHQPHRVVRAFEEVGINLDEQNLVLPVRERGAMGIPTWAPGFVPLTPQARLVVANGWWRTRRAAVAWSTVRPSIVNTWFSIQLWLDGGQRRSLLVFLPLTKQITRNLHDEVQEAAREHRLVPASASLLATPTLDTMAR